MTVCAKRRVNVIAHFLLKNIQRAPPEKDTYFLNNLKARSERDDVRSITHDTHIISMPFIIYRMSGFVIASRMNVSCIAVFAPSYSPLCIANIIDLSSFMRYSSAG